MTVEFIGMFLPDKKCPGVKLSLDVVGDKR